jgi:acetyl-CoA synthetase
MDWRIRSFDEYKKSYELAKSEPEKFWGAVADTFTWKKSWDIVQSGSMENADVSWFEGGELNITENCLDRHLDKRGDKPALVFEANDPTGKTQTYSFNELHQAVCKAANMLEENGIKKGDVVCLYMGMVPELMISVLACARIGAIHSVVFGGFSANALRSRILDADVKMVITNDGSLRGKKIIPLKDICDEALENNQCPTVKKVIVHKRANNQIKMNPIDVWWNDVFEPASDKHEAASLKSEDTLFILYTSGSTGQPKGIEHSVAGYMTWAAYTFENVFQVDEDDMYWCTADIGWVTGHTYTTYGPLLSGKATLMFEGIPTWPDAGRFWDICDKYKVTHFYTAPTAIRALMACGTEIVDKHDLSSLKVLGSVGEPINEEAWVWYNQHIGKEKCPIVDTWWQTETGGIMISPLAGLTKTKPCFATLALPGIYPELVDDKGQVIEGNGVGGNLVISRPWPGMLRTIFRDHDRFVKTYLSTYPGKFFTGDGCKRDVDGYYRITGRVDDVINVSGHRIGTAEVEDAINQHPHIIESAVCGFPHDIKGQGIYAYVIMDQGMDSDILEKEVLDIVTKHIGPIAKPDKIQPVDGLPKTRSGKIMRRILRKVAANELGNFGDTSTLLDPSVVDAIIAGRK